MVIRKIWLILASLLMLWVTGCATGRGTPVPMSEQEIDALKVRLGKIGVTRARFVPSFVVQTPSKGAKEGAKDGAKEGALVPLGISLMIMQGGCAGNPECFLLPFAGLALAPVGAAIGTVGGAITADPAEKVNERESMVKAALAKLRIQETMRDRFVSQLAGRKKFPFSVVDETGPTKKGELPDYRPLKSSGIDTVNEIDVVKLTLTGKGKVRPDLAVHLEAWARLVSTSDNIELYYRPYTCSSEYDKFEAWAAQEAQKFRGEIEHCYDDIAKRAVDDLYVNKWVEHWVPERGGDAPTP